MRSRFKFDRRGKDTGKELAKGIKLLEIVFPLPSFSSCLFSKGRGLYDVYMLLEGASL